MSVSVVIPARDAARVLPRAIESALGQTEPPSEVLVVDNDSTDETAVVAQAYGPRVRYVRLATAGVSAARNAGILEATSEWIAFLDADDEWLPPKLERQLRRVHDANGLRWCAANMETVDDGTARPGVVHPSLLDRLTRGEPLSYFEAARLGLPFQTSGVLVHRDLLCEVGLFDPGLTVSEDRDLWCRIALRQPRLAYCPEPSFRYHADTPTSLMKSTRDRSAGLRSLCRNLERAGRSDPAVAAQYRQYARGLVLDYLLRAATGEITINEAARLEARAAFFPRRGEGLLLAGLERLPPLLTRAAARLWERSRASGGAAG